MSTSLPGRRWASTRYKVGDTVKHKALTYVVHRVDMLRGSDGHPKPYYVLRRYYKKTGKFRFYATEGATAANLKKA